MSVERRTGAIAFGANLGDRERNLKGALARLEKTPGLVVLRRSPWRPSAPQGGPPDQPEYLNGVAFVETVLGAHELLDVLLAIEEHFGRNRAQEVRFGPRLLDLDLLFLGDLAFDDERLQLPHPRMEERRFVLQPLAELCPDYVLPSGRTPAAALEALAQSPAQQE